MSSAGFFEVHIATHQRGTSGIDYGTIHGQMESNEFERVIQTTAQSANEVPGGYRLRRPQLTIEQVMERLHVVLAPLGLGMSVRVMKVEEEKMFDLVSTVSPPGETDPKGRRSRSSGGAVEAQSGYPTWRRPR